MRSLLRFLVLFSFATLTLRGATPVNCGEYVMTVWRTEDGLPQNSVFSLAEGPDGYLWLATRNGLGRFDGVTFKTFLPENTPGISFNRIRLVYTQRNGVIWIHAEDGSLSTYKDGRFHHAYTAPDGTQTEVRHFLAETSSGALFGLTQGRLLMGPADNIHQIQSPYPFDGFSRAGNAEDTHGVIWFVGSSGQVIRFVSSKFEVLPPEFGLKGKSAHFITIDSEKRICVGTEAGIEILEDQKFRVAAPYSKPYHMLASKRGGLWIWQNNRLFKWGLAGASNSIAFPSNWTIREEIEDSAGYLWVGTFGEGLWRVNPNGEKMVITTKDGLPGDRAYAIIEDRNGNVIVGTDGGMARFQPSRFKIWKDNPVITERYATTVCPDGKGGVWMGTFGGGLYHYGDGDWQQIKLPGVPLDAVVYTVLQLRTGALWIGTRSHGLLRIENGVCMRPLPGGKNDDSIRVLFEDSKGDLWIGDNEDLRVLRAGTTNTATIVSNADIRAITEDGQGNLWVGTQSRGLLRRRDGKIEEFRKAQGLPSDFIWSLFSETNGTLWIGTSGAGMARYKNGKFKTLHANDGLPDGTITHLELDDYGRMWAGTYHGVFSISKSALEARADGGTDLLHCIRHGSEEGLPAGECAGGAQPTGAKTADGSIWFPTAGGLAVTKPTKQLSNISSPQAVIESMTVDNQSIPSNRQAPPGSSRYAIKYTAPTLSGVGNIHFRYRLDGLHTGWIEAEGRREAFFDRLHPGSYTFRVMASNTAGEWEGTEAQLAFVVLPFFWQTRTFQVSLILAGVALLALAVRWQATRELRRKLANAEQKAAMEQERERISRDMHDTIGARLTTISLLGDLANRNLSQPDEARPQLQRLSKLAGETAGTLSALIWTVNPANDTLPNLATRICQETEEFLRDSGIRCRFDFPDNLPDITVPSLVRRHVVLTVAEAVNNVLKHSGATEIQLGLKLQEKAFVITISDNGRGLPAVQLPRLTGGNGLPNMHERLTKCGGTCSILNQPQGGVLVELSVPIGRG